MHFERESQNLKLTMLKWLWSILCGIAARFNSIWMRSSLIGSGNQEASESCRAKIISIQQRSLAAEKVRLSVPSEHCYSFPSNEPTQRVICG
jgi:hypothetical protein